MRTDLNPDAPIRGPSKYGGITGQIAVGRYVLQIGDPCGALVREASRAERAHIRPRATPILLRPRLIRALIDRRMEVAGALSAFDAGLPIEVSGEPGIGKTAILRHLAHHPRAASFVDGIVYLPARHHSFFDLQQLLFEAFYESDEPCKPTESEIRRGLQEKQALIILDDVHLPQNELEQILDIAPHSAFVVATSERRLWGEVRSLALGGLSPEDAVMLLEREIERVLDLTDRADATRLCAAIGGHPLRIQQIAAVICDQGMSLEDWAHTITPQSLLRELMSSIDEKQRRALLALTALSGVPLRAQHISGMAEVTDIEPSLMTLVRRGLVVCSQSRHQLADGVADQLRRTEDLAPWVNRAITYFMAWAGRYRRSPDALLEEAEALLRVQQHALESRRWGEVLALGWLVEGALVVRGRWGAWATTLERSLDAAKALGDRSAEAWAFHEIGTRALCLGEADLARASLSQAVKLRELLGDDAATTTSRQNLSIILPPAADVPIEHPRTSSAEPRSSATPPPPAEQPMAPPVPTSLPAQTLDFDSLPLRDAILPPIRVQKTTHAGVVLVAVVLFAILGGVGFWIRSAEIRWPSWNSDAIGSFAENSISFVENGLRSVMARRSTTPPQRRAATGSSEPRQEEPRAVSFTESDLLPADPPAAASILIFTARPGSITRGGPTNLCYAVSSALQVRLEPEIGDVGPRSTLTCVRVAPARTTTYELTAYGPDGHHTSQQLVIVVR
jgi:NB-ARC domain-containing protein